MSRAKFCAAIEVLNQHAIGYFTRGRNRPGDFRSHLRVPQLLNNSMSLGLSFETHEIGLGASEARRHYVSRRRGRRLPRRRRHRSRPRFSCDLSAALRGRNQRVRANCASRSTSTPTSAPADSRRAASLGPHAHGPGDRSREYRRVLRRSQHVLGRRRIHAHARHGLGGAQNHCGRARAGSPSPAFELAASRRKKVTAVHKANVMKVSDALFLREVRDVAKNYPGVAYDEQLVDSMAALLVRDAARFDVVVTTNMFGDILVRRSRRTCPAALGLAGSLNAGDSHAHGAGAARLRAGYCRAGQGQSHFPDSFRRHAA